MPTSDSDDNNGLLNRPFQEEHKPLFNVAIFLEKGGIGRISLIADY
jgi:hypothetical protein